MRIEDISLLKVEGGSLSGSVLNYLSTALKTIYNIGQELGGAIRRIATKTVCPV